VTVASPDTALASKRPRTATRLVFEEMLCRTVALGAQWTVATADEVCTSGAIGEAGTQSVMTVDTVHKLWCAAKPLTALVAMDAFEAAGVELDAAVGDVLGGTTPVNPEVGEVAVRDLLDHRACIRGLTIPEFLLASRRARGALVASASVDSEARGAGRTRYSDLAAWVLLSEIARTATGRDADELLREWLHRRFGDVDLFGRMTREEFDGVRGRIGCYVSNLAGVARPWLTDRTFEFASEYSGFAFGGYGTTDALVAFGLEVLRSGRLDRVQALRRGPADDVLLGRRCEFAGGFMVGLADHGFGHAPGAGAVAHVGWMGNSFLLIDPDRQVVAAAITNGIEDPTRLAEWRPRIVERMYSDAG